MNVELTRLRSFQARSGVAHQTDTAVLFLFILFITITIKLSYGLAGSVWQKRDIRF